MTRLPPVTATLVILLAIAAGVIAARDEQVQRPWFDGIGLDRRQGAMDGEQLVRGVIRAFAESGSDPCSLARSEFGGHPVLFYESVEGLVNDSYLIVRGKPLSRNVLAPEPPSAYGDVPVTLSVQEVLRGSYSENTITVSFGSGVSFDGANLRRVVSVLDACTTDPLVLFLQRSGDGNQLWFTSQGWANIADGIESFARNNLFGDYADADSLLSAIRQIVDEQDEQGMVTGQVACEDARMTVMWAPQLACPGETFNPYETYNLGSAMSGKITLRDGAGGSEQSDVALDEQFWNLVRTLDVEATAESAGRWTIYGPDEMSLYVIVEEAEGDEGFDFRYSPSTRMIRLPHLFSGQIPASPEFQSAIEHYLTAP